jgi:hypothetical protein
MQAVDLLLISLAIVLSFIIVVIAEILPRLFEIIYQIKTTKDLMDFIPNITRVAFQNSWSFAATLAVISIAGIFQLHRWPNQILKFTILNLCLQTFVFWIAMFCYCYDGFLGPMSLHHDPEFDLANFIGFCWGIFPVSLVAILIPVPFALAIKKQVPAKSF